MITRMSQFTVYSLQFTVKMPLKFMEEAFLLLCHKYGELIIAMEGQLELHTADISVNDMCPDEQCAVKQPCAACSIAQVVDREASGLHSSYSECQFVCHLLMHKGQDSFIVRDGDTEMPEIGVFCLYLKGSAIDCGEAFGCDSTL